jgi:hypothetical protein
MLRIFPLLLIAFLPVPCSAQFTVYSSAVATGEPLLPARDVLLGNLQKRVNQGEAKTSLRAIYPNDLPMELPGGTYVLERSDGTKETFELSENQPRYGIETVYLPGPYGVFNHEGTWRRTDGMALRSPEDVSATMRMRWPFYEKGRTTAVAPPEFSDTSRTAALETIRRDLEAETARIVTILDGRSWADLPARDRTEIYTLQDGSLPQMIDALAASGAAEDAVTLYTLAETFDAAGLFELPAQMINAAVAIETRYNVLARGMGALMFKAHLTIEDADILPQVVLAMARQGYRPALTYLLEHLPAGTLPNGWDDEDKLAAFKIVQRYDTPALRDLAWDVLIAQANHVVAKVTGNTAGHAPPRLPVPAAAPTAFLYLASVGAGTEALTLPLWDMQSLMIDIAPAVNAPDELLSLFLRARRQFSHAGLTEMVCSLLAGRTVDAALLDRSYAIYLEFARRIEHIRPEWFAATMIDDGLTHCLVSPNRIGQLDGASAEVMWVYPKPWRYAVAGVADALGVNEGNPARAVHHYLADDIPQSWLDPVLDPVRDSVGVTRYRAYRTLATTAFHFDHGPYQGGAMQRMFVQPFKRQSEAERRFFAFGVASLYLQPQPERSALWIGIGLDVTSSVRGLAGAIGNDAELIEATVSGGARGMIDRVVFRNGEVVHDLEFAETVDTSLHIFSLDTEEVSAANAIIDLYLSTKNTSGESLNDWVVSFPLWQSPLAFEQRLASGEMFFQFEN